MKKLWLVGLIIIVLTLSGCKTAKVESDGGSGKVGKNEIKVDKNKGSFKYKNEKSEGSAQIGEDVELPDDFPKDVPVYKNAKLTSAITTKSDNGSLTAITLETKDGKDEVAKFYEDGLTENGFEIQGRFEIEKSTTITAIKSGTNVVVVATTDEGKTMIGTNITTKLN